LEEPLPLNVATYNKIKKVIGFNSRYVQNQLGKGNVLNIAENLAISARGGSVEGEATKLDGNAIAKLLAAAGNSTEFTVVTTTTTQTRIVTNGSGNGAPAAEAGKAEPEKTESGKAEVIGAEEGKVEEGKAEGGKVGVEELISTPQGANAASAADRTRPTAAIALLSVVFFFVW